MARELAGTGAATAASERVAIVTRGEGAASCSAEETVRLVSEMLRPGETVTAVSWRRALARSAMQAPEQ